MAAVHMFGYVTRYDDNWWRGLGVRNLIFN